MIMKKNIGSIDKIIRFVVSAVLITMYATELVTGTWGIVLLVVSGILTLTAVINFCPIWAAVGFRTNKAPA